MTTASAGAQDWPSWRGRGQDGISIQQDLVSAWSKDGENLIWSDSWIGRSTPAVFDGRVCANGRTGDDVAKQEIVACWSAENGTKLWEHKFSVMNTTVPFNRVGWGNVTGDPETGYLYALNIDDPGWLLYRRDVKAYALLIMNIARELSRRLHVADRLIAGASASVAREYVRRSRG